MSYPYCARRYGSFDTHIAIVHDTLCHATSVIKCHQMSFDDKWRVTLWVINYSNMGIKRTVLTSTIRLLHQNVFLEWFIGKNWKKQISQFFLCKCLCNKIDSRGSTSWPPRKLIWHFLNLGKTLKNPENLVNSG